jgi:hypothetical protein
VLRRGDARRLLLWSERWRATTLTPRGTPPADDPELLADLAALRDVNRRLEAARAEGSATAILERSRRILEETVRARTRWARSRGAVPANRLDPDELFAELGSDQLIELVEVDGVLLAVTVTGRRVRLHTVGPVPDSEVDMARFTLRRIAYGPSPRPESMLRQEGVLLEAALLGPAVADLADGPVVVIPTGRLHAVPWSLLPSLRGRPVSVAPSTSTWLQARRRKAPAVRKVTLVVGPGLGSGGAEVPQLAQDYPGSTTLGQGTATADRVLAALDGAWLAHIAAHGTFRVDNPLFSSLRLDDGPLTVYDFERLRRAPYQLVLSSCDSGVSASVGADELLGLVSSLVPLGAVAILASVVPVNDAATVPLMIAVHDALRAGETLPEALLSARQETANDLVAAATAHSFIALGA